MGAAVSSARQSLTRPLRTYNVEERAMKVISKDKPTPAPTHPAMKKIMEDIIKDPSKLKSSRTDPNLLENLSKIHITSTGDNPDVYRQRLPKNRSPPGDLLYGYEDPKVLPPGKASLRQILEIIVNNTKDPDAKVDVEQIAKQYKLDVVDVMNILQYCKTLLIINPPPPEPKVKSKNPLRRFQDVLDNVKK